MAVYPVATGIPDLKAQNWIPTLFASKIQRELYEWLVANQITNTDYQGDFSKHGDTINIPILPDANMRPYDIGQNIIYDDPSPSYVQMLIDQGVYWAFNTHDVNVKQSHINFPPELVTHYTRRAAENIDAALLAYAPGQVHASNTGATAGADSGNINLGVAGAPFSATSANLEEFVANCAIVLDEQKAPREGRYFVVPPWMQWRLALSDIADSSKMGGGVSSERNGKIGMVAGFTFYVSSQLTVTADVIGSNAWSCVFGHKSGLSFAQQLSKVQKVTAEFQFAERHRALIVYGRKMVEPRVVGRAYVMQG